MTDIKRTGNVQCILETERKLFPDIRYPWGTVKKIKVRRFIPGKEVMDSSGSAASNSGANAIGREIMNLYPGDIVSTNVLPTAFFDISLVLLFTPFAAIFTHDKYLNMTEIENEVIINNYVYYILYLDIMQ